MYILTISLLTLILAQFIKIFTVFPPSISRFFESGGMPSSHSAFVTCLSVLVGLQQGFNSDLFAVSAVFSLVTIYDSGGVRRSVGEQAKILNKLLKEFDPARLEEDKDQIRKNLHELVGHTPFEILAGIMLGFTIALLAV